jgi:hypothetical protein
MRPDRFLMPLWLALAFFVPSAGAQDAEASHYDGTWTVRLRCPDGSSCAARLVLRDFEGTWQDLQGKRSAKGACGAKKIPLTVQSSKLSHLAFKVWGELCGGKVNGRAHKVSRAAQGVAASLEEG